MVQWMCNVTLKDRNSSDDVHCMLGGATYVAGTL